MLSKGGGAPYDNYWMIRAKSLDSGECYSLRLFHALGENLFIFPLDKLS